jgi:phosphohistidine phosphatase
LTAHGKECVATVATALRDRREALPRILSSPLVRAVQTAEMVRTTLGVTPEIEIRDELAPAESSVSLALELARGPDAAVLFVSHAPDVSELCAALTGAHTGGFSAGMIVALDLEVRGAVRRFVIEP